MPDIQWYGRYKCAKCTQEYDAMNKRENQGFACPKCGAQNTPSLDVSNPFMYFAPFQKKRAEYVVVNIVDSYFSSKN